MLKSTPSNYYKTQLKIQPTSQNLIEKFEENQILLCFQNCEKSAIFNPRLK